MKSTRDAQRRLMNVQQAAEYLNTGDRFVRRLVAERRIDFIKVGRFVRFDPEVLDAYIDYQTVRAVRRDTRVI